MRRIVRGGIAAICFLLTGCDSGGDDPEARAQEIARTHIIVDTHIDVPYRLHRNFEDVSGATENGQFDYPRAVAGGLDAPFMSIYVPAEHEELGDAKAFADQLIDDVEGMVAANPDKFALAFNPGDVRQAFTDGKIALPMGMENGAPIEGNLANLEHFHARGIRYITLAHSKANHISDSSYDENRLWNGLSPFGKELVKAMNNIGIMVDVSHLSDEAFWDVIAASRAPIIASHSSARHFIPGFERNIPDDQIAAIGENGGVVMINFGSGFVSDAAHKAGVARGEAYDAYLEENALENEREIRNAFFDAYNAEHPYPFATLAVVLDHFDHVVDIAGIDHVGIGSDYDGVGDTLPADLKDVSSYPNLIAGLLERGYSEDDVAKVLSGNILRVWERVTELGAARSAP